jgi:hypothetical protein
MILSNDNTYKVEGAEEFRSVECDISEKGKVHFLNLMRDSIYQNPIKALIREVAANAYDAQKRAGNEDKPFQITFPSQYQDSYKTRDFGTGLSKDEVFAILPFFGESTKNDSNNEIGGFGIGFKSPLAYGPNFVIASYFNGVKSVYNYYISENKKGRIAQMDESPTEEPNGLEIIVPVKNGDRDKFVSEAKNIFRFWKVKPEVFGLSEWELSYFKSSITRPEAILSGDKWTFRGAGDGHVIMGNIGYPIAKCQLELNDSKLEILCDNVDLEFGIGELEVVASRDGLRYSEDTKSKVTSFLTQIKSTIGETIKNKFETFETEWDYALAYHKIFNERGYSDKIMPLIRSEKLWKGKEIEEPNPCYFESCLLYSYRCVGESAANWVFSRATPSHRIVAKENCVILLNDIGNNNKLKLIPYIRGFLSKKSADITNFYILCPNGADIETTISHASWSGAPVKRLSEIEPLYVPRKARSVGSSAANGAKKGNSCTFDKEGLKDNNASFWEESEIDFKNGAGYYVPISHHKPDYNEFYLISNPCIAVILESVEEILGEEINLIGVVSSKVGKLGSGWVNFIDFAKNQIEQAVNSTENLETMKNAEVVNSYASYTLFARIRNIKSECPMIQDFVETVSGILRKPLHAFKSEYAKIGVFLKSTLPTYDVSSAVSGILSKYPILRYSGPTLEELQNYVNLVNDSLTKK